MSVGEFCNREVVVADKSTSLVVIAQLMREHHVGCIVITESQGEVKEPIGIITDRDIVLEIVAPQLDLEAVAVGDVMSGELLLAREVDGLWETLKRMRSRGVRRVPVINDENVLVGILTVDDILEILANEFSEVITVLNKERRKEEAARTLL
ncbi:MAG: CBS domain-containing protein [Gammaproteobacteria bacterium]|nr:CBS domain-containing protein [Gammaproteobacteria bacterium]